MALISATDQFPVFLSRAGVPLSFGKLFAYAIGTSTPKTWYTDKELTVPADNPLILDVNGCAETQLYLDSGSYTILAQKFNGTDAQSAPPEDWSDDHSWEQDGVETTTVAPVTDVITVETIAALRLVDPAEYTTALVLGYNTATDSFARRYWWDAVAVEADNYGSIINSSVEPSGRWRLLIDGDSVDVRVFGMIPNTTNTYNSQLTALETWAYNSGLARAIYFPAGTYRFAGAYTPTIRPKLILDQGVKFYNTVVSTTVAVTCVNDYEIRLLSGIQSSSSVGTCVLGFGTGTEEVKALWYGHVNGTDDHSTIVAQLTAYVGVNRPILIDNVLNAFTLSSAFPIRLKTIKFGQINCSHDPSGNNYRIELYSVDMGTPNALKLTYPNVLSIDYLENSRLRASWFDNASALTDWSAMLESTGIYHTATYPTVIVDDNIKFASAMSDNAWTIVSEGGEMDIHSAGVQFYRIQAGDVPLFSALSTHAPSIRCAVRGTWWDFAGCTTNQTIEYAITAASTGGGIIADFAGCGAMTGYSVELIIDNEIEIRNLSMTGTGDFRPQANARFIDCTLARTGGATGNEGVISLTGGGGSAENFDVIRCNITSVNYGISHQPLRTRIKDSRIVLTSGNYSVWASADVEIDNCEIMDGLLLEEVSYAKITRSILNDTVVAKSSSELKNIIISENQITMNGGVATKIRFLATSADVEVNNVFVERNTFTGSLAAATKCIEFAEDGGTFKPAYFHTARIGGNLVPTGSNIIAPMTYGTIQHDIDFLSAVAGGQYMCIAQILAGPEESDNQILVIPGDLVIGSSMHLSKRLEYFDSGVVDPSWHQTHTSGTIKKQTGSGLYSMMSVIQNALDGNFGIPVSYPAMVTFENYSLNNIVP